MGAIALFDPCYMAALRPGDAECARHVLESLGDEVTLIDGRCCGQPAFNSGYRDEARKTGRELLKAARPFETVVTLSGSCTAMVRNYLPMTWDGERRQAAARLGSRFRDFVSYVARHPNIERLGLKLDGVVAYHDSCHGRRELGITADAVRLLGRVEGLEVRRLAHEEECCGFGGTFAVKLPEISVAMMTAKLDDVSATKTRVLISGDYSCLAHLESGAKNLGMKLETWTFAELLSRALE